MILVSCLNYAGIGVLDRHICPCFNSFFITYIFTMQFLDQLSKSISYNEFLALVDKLLDEGRVTGPVQSADLLAYSQLNRKRIERLDKTVRVDESISAKLLSEIKAPMAWLTITEGWCGDAAQILPAIGAMSKVNPLVQHRIILRDQNLDVIDQFLTNGGRAIPKVLFLDPETGELLGHWGPRPRAAQQIMDDHKLAMKAEGLTDEQKKESAEDAKTRLHTWYAHNKTADTQAEFLEAVIHASHTQVIA